MLRFAFGLITLSCSLVSTADAFQTCGVPATTETLDAQVDGPLLWTPYGPPVLGGLFAVQVSDAPPGSFGVLLYSSNTTGAFVPSLQGLIFPGSQGLTIEVAQADASGQSLQFIGASALPASYCGTSVTAQAAFIDATSPGGFALTNGLKLRAGAPTVEPLFPERAETSHPADHFVTCDLNSDGNTDLIAFGVELLYCDATGCYYEPRLTIHMGQADGGFVETAGFPAAFVPTYKSTNIAVADLNGDGIEDVIVGDDALYLRLMIGQGDGTFIEGPLPTSTPINSNSLTLGDLEGDGDLDVFSVEHWLSIRVFENDGAGNFTQLPDVYGGPNVERVITANFDGIAGIDLLAINTNDEDTRCLVGDGTGNFLLASMLPSQTAIGYSIVLDFNSDGQDDIITAEPMNDRLLFRDNQVGGQFWSTDARALRGVTHMTTGFLNSDSVTDMLVTAILYGSSHAQLVPFLGTGFGMFQGADRFGTDIETSTTRIANGHVLVADRTNKFISNIPLRSDGSLRAPRIRPSIEEPCALVVGDLDNDGLDDVVVAGVANNELEVLLGNGTGRLTSAGTSSTLTDPVALALGDLNSDGVLDLVTAHETSSLLRVQIGTGTGDFMTATSLALSMAASDIQLADVNNDGKLDLVCCHYFNWFLQNTGASVLLGNGDGTFGAPIEFSGSGYTGLVVADVNNDTFLDLVLARQTPSQVEVALGDGTGSFAAALVHLSGALHPADIATADIDGDGLLDVVVCMSTGKQISVSLGLGDGTFQPAVLHALEHAAKSLQVLDFDGDGGPDVLCTSDTNLAWIANADLLTPDSASTLASGAGGSAIAALDLEHDGDIDVVVANFALDELWILPNRSGG